ncbi:MAG: two-component regulator propeller domain-containing protein [Prolixibacteraceae bacterium]
MKKTYTYILVISIILFFGITGPAKCAVTASNLRFQYLTTDEGLAQNTVDCIFKDNQGFMWFGTWNGLCRYDGYNFKTYQKNSQPDGLPDNFIRTVTQDLYGDLWIGTANGLIVFNTEKEKFFSPGKIAESLNKSAITSAICDQSGNIWVGTEKGLLVKMIAEKVKSDSVNWNLKPIDTGILNGASINAVYNLQNNTILVGTVSGIYKIVNGTAQRADISIPATANVLCIFESHSGDLYLGTDNGLYWFRKSSDSATQLNFNKFDEGSISHDVIRAIGEDLNGTILIGTLGGLNFFYPSLRKIERVNGRADENGRLNNEFVNSLYTDSGGDVWIGTDKGGVNKFNMFQKPFYAIRNHRDEENSLSHNTINSILKDDHYLWVGTAGGGLNRIDQVSGKVKKYPYFNQALNGLQQNFISALCKDQHNQLWVCKWGGGLSHLLPGDQIQSYINNPQIPESLTSNFVSSISSDDRGFLVIGTLGGIDLFDPKTQIFHHFQDQLINGGDNHEVGCILKDHNGFYWFGSRSGLFRIPADLVNLSGKKLEESDYDFYTNNPEDSTSISGSYIISLLEDSKGNIWIGTYGNGICRVLVSQEGKISFKSYTQADGLCNNVIYTMENDLDGNIWISTDKGLSKFNPENATFDNYYTKDGLLSDQFYWAASESDDLGNLYFGGVNGLNYFNPKEIVSYPRKPKVVFTDFRVFNQSVTIGEKLHGQVVLGKSISQTSAIELSYRDNVFSIEFSALDFFLPDKITYAYKMEGVDQNWVIVPASRRFAGYTNLGGGDYRFLVKAANSDGVWSDKISELRIRILPPFWQTSWFRFAFVFGIIALVMAYIRYRTYLLHEQKRKLEQQVHERTLQIEAQKEKLLEQSEILKQSNHELAERQVLIEGQKIELEEQNQLIARQRDEVIDLNKQVSLINQLRLRFFTNISHEFRTPLTLILDPLESLMKNMDADKKTKQTLRLINRNAQRLLHLINQLMYFRRIETGKIELRVVQGDFREFMGGIFESFVDLANHQKITYSFHSEDLPQYTWFDAEKLENVFYNLLSNAFKFTPEGGHISVSISIIDQKSSDAELSIPQLKVDICDDGKGISAEDLPYVFDRFYQAESTADNRQKGSGIGLALTQELVQSVHGSISVTSELRHGSTFSVLLPFRKEDFAENEIDRTGSVQSSNLQSKVDLMSEEILRTESFEDLEPQSTDKTKPFILIVEDNYDLRSFLLQSMKSDFRVMGAENGKEGFELAKKFTPDLIVSDIMMPVMDGLELCSRLKKEIHTSHIPVILLTAKVMIEQWVEGLEIGADDYIPKPFNLKILQLKIANLIESRRKLRQLYSHGENPAPEDSTTNQLDQQFIERALAIIEKHIPETDLTVDKFAREMMVSKSLLFKKIKAITGYSIVDFINMHKLKKAAGRLATDPTVNISEVSFEVGFNDPKYFSRIFRKVYGVSPSEYSEDPNAHK